MCFGGDNPRAPEPPPAPAAPQDPNLADLSDTRKKRAAQSGMAGGTLLTGAGGVDNSQLNTAKGSLLGG